jgi:cytochrome b6-f complex iron-sulfur subunit
MSATTIFFVTILVVFVLAGAGIFAVAFRRPAGSGPATGSFDVRAARRDRMRYEREVAGGVATMVATEVAAEEEATVEETAAEPASEGPAPDPIQHRVQVSAAEYGTTRRMFLNRSLGGLFGFFGLVLGAGILAMLWPRLKGGFGTPIAVGNFDDIREAAVQPDGTFIPQFFAAAQSWVVPFDPSSLPNSSFEATPDVVVGGGAGELGLMALWQRCVHLGCRVPSCVPSQGFECPCHGSKYNLHGEYEAGPAPRNMDRFAVEIDDAGNLVVRTGEIVETPRAQNKTIQYPLGPFCV